MKLSFWDRALALIYLLLTLALCAAVFLRSMGIDLIGRFLTGLTQTTHQWYFIFYGVLLIVVLLGAYLLTLIFARKEKKTAFVTVDAGDNGKVIVAMSALEQMVRQASRNAEGVTDMKIAVHGEEDAISVSVELTVLGGVHLPTVTMNLQREIRRYVEMNCGVAVRDVTVTVGAVLSQESGEAETKEESHSWLHAAKERHAAEEPAVIYQPLSVEPDEEIAAEPADEAPESESVAFEDAPMPATEPVEAEAEPEACAEDETPLEES